MEEKPTAQQIEEAVANWISGGGYSRISSKSGYSTGYPVMQPIRYQPPAVPNLSINSLPFKKPEQREA